MEINLNTNKVYGTGGCNNINGNVEVKGKYIRFSRIISTRMACTDGGFENRYLAALSANDMLYKVDNGLLKVQSDSSIFTYRKID
ncbi:MAG: META domain-containing protein [Chitinophagaceae bacterium]|nr:META domain-containing protein [Chitinophagaceae bacterium]